MSLPSAIAQQDKQVTTDTNEAPMLLLTRSNHDQGGGEKQFF